MKVMARHSSADTSTRSPRPGAVAGRSGRDRAERPEGPTVHSASPPPTARGPDRRSRGCGGSRPGPGGGGPRSPRRRGAVEPEGREAHHHQLGVAIGQGARASTAGGHRPVRSPKVEAMTTSDCAGQVVDGVRRPTGPRGRSPGSACDEARNRKRAPSGSPSLPTEPDTDQRRSRWPSGGSTLVTLAPASASSLAQYAPATSSDRSRTRSPSRPGADRRSPVRSRPRRVDRRRPDGTVAGDGTHPIVEPWQDHPDPSARVRAALRSRKQTVAPGPARTG